METAIKERPILFSAPMVRALLDGSKIKTRRTNGFEWTNLSMPGMWDKVETGIYRSEFGAWFRFDDQGINRDVFIKCPYGKVGDRLWVRESFSVTAFYASQDNSTEAGSDEESAACRVKYHADGAESYVDELSCNNDFGVDEEEQALRASKNKSSPSIHMPRWASRINLEITGVRVERLNDISDVDAINEGIISEHHVWREPEYPLPDIAYRPSAKSEYRYTCPKQAFQDLWESINGAGSWQENPYVWVIEFKRI